MPLTSTGVQQIMARFVTFTAYLNVKTYLKGAVHFKQVQRQI